MAEKTKKQPKPITVLDKVKVPVPKQTYTQKLHKALRGLSERRKIK